MKSILLLVLFFTSYTNCCTAQTYSDKISKHRETYLAELTGEHAPLKKADLKNVHFFEPDTSYVVLASVKLLTDENPFIIPAFDGAGREYVRYAKLNFILKNKNLELTIFKSLALATNPDYKDYLFLPFTDSTNLTKTYGGGRYLDFRTGEIINSQLHIDFNKAYNPYCAFGSGYSCPAPPRENNLETDITAGEKAYTGKK